MRVSVKLRAGDKQHFVFQWNDPHPFYDVHAQRFDKDRRKSSGNESAGARISEETGTEAGVIWRSNCNTDALPENRYHERAVCGKGFRG